MTKLIVDCLGGDHSPSAPVEGAVAALRENPDLSLVLAGDETVLREELKKYGGTESERLAIVHAPDVIDPGEKPTDAIRQKKESSLVKAIEMLRCDESLSGLVSTGSTGAIVAAGTLRIGRLKNVIRPAFCPILPTMNGGIVGVCDSGANVDVDAARLQQFAIMGSRYLQTVYGIETPRVALLNIGTEEEKGDALRKETYPLLAATPGIHFVGNMESRDLLSGRYDLVVCDGFAGNVLIKSTEGACLEMLKKLKTDIASRLVNKIGALFLYRMFMQEKEFMNYQNYGGSVLLGTKKVIVKGHGSSKAKAVTKCIEQAYKMAAGGYGDELEKALAALKQ